MKRPTTAAIAGTGVCHIEKVVLRNNCIFQRISQENDVGVDGIIEFVVDESATGCCVGVQIKSGESYVRGDRFLLRSDAAHLDYWKNHVLPIVGLVYDPATDTAKWVDLTAFALAQNTLEAVSSPVANFPFDMPGFSAFRDHFLAYRDRFSDERHLARSLTSLSRIDAVSECATGLAALFGFHRNKPEAWFYMLSALRCFRDSPLLRRLVVTLSHVPGHGDILWGPKNMICEETTKMAEDLFKRYLSRDDVLTLISIIDDENGLGRGGMGQCVEAIIRLAPKRDSMLESIATDVTVSERHRFWAALLLVSILQWHEADRCIIILEKIVANLSGEEEEDTKIASLAAVLRRGERLDFS